MSISNDLRQAVLQAAIQGKLTKQLPEDGNAKDLLEQIKAEKEKLIKEGKLKREKPLPEITDDEKPFDIPENWEWCRIGDLFMHASGKQQSSSNKTKGEPKEFITTSNLYWGYFVLDTVKIMNFTDAEIISCSATKGDLLVCEGGAGYGRSAIWNYEYDICLQNHIHRLRPMINGVCEYVYYWMYFLKENNKLAPVGTAMPGLSANRLKGLLISLPPLSEQKRIVAKVEELMAKIDGLEKTEQELESLKKTFPTDMKASLLQAAMQGKLTEQLPEDGNAKDLLEQIKAEKAKLIKDGKLKKDKPLPEITEDEIPFDIPENWEWCRIGEVGMTLTGNTPSTTKLEYYNGDVPFIGPGDISIDSQINYDTSKKLTALGAEVARLVKNETLLQVCIGGSIGKVCLVERTVAFNQQINALTPIKMLSKFAFYVMKSQMFLDGMFEKSTGTATPIINRTAWEQLLIPLPPLSEQKRIVEKLEKLLPLCDGLK